MSSLTTLTLLAVPCCSWSLATAIDVSAPFFFCQTPFTGVNRDGACQYLTLWLGIFLTESDGGSHSEYHGFLQMDAIRTPSDFHANEICLFISPLPLIFFPPALFSFFFNAKFSS